MHEKNKTFIPNMIKAEAREDARREWVSSQTITNENGMIKVPRMAQNWKPHTVLVLMNLHVNQIQE